MPVFTRAREREGEARAHLLARRVLGTLAAVTGLVTLLGIVFAPAIVAVVAADAPAAQRPLTIALTRVMFPFLVLAALAAAVMGMLNTYRRYFVPALAPAAFNVVAVLGGGGWGERAGDLAGLEAEIEMPPRFAFGRAWGRFRVWGYSESESGR